MTAQDILNKLTLSLKATIFDFEDLHRFSVYEDHNEENILFILEINKLENEVSELDDAEIRLSIHRISFYFLEVGSRFELNIQSTIKTTLIDKIDEFIFKSDSINSNGGTSDDICEKKLVLGFFEKSVREVGKIINNNSIKNIKSREDANELKTCLMERSRPSMCLLDYIEKEIKSPNHKSLLRDLSSTLGTGISGDKTDLFESFEVVSSSLFTPLNDDKRDSQTKR